MPPESCAVTGREEHAHGGLGDRHGEAAGKPDGISERMSPLRGTSEVHRARRGRPSDKPEAGSSETGERAKLCVINRTRRRMSSKGEKEMAIKQRPGIPEKKPPQTARAPHSHPTPPVFSAGHFDALHVPPEIRVSLWYRVSSG